MGFARKFACFDARQVRCRADLPTEPRSGRFEEAWARICHYLRLLSFYNAARSSVDELAKLYACFERVVISVFPHAQHLKVILFISLSTANAVLRYDT